MVVARRCKASLFFGAVVVACSLVASAAVASAAPPSHSASGFARIAAALHLSPSTPFRYGVVPYQGPQAAPHASSQLPTWTHTVDSPAGNPFSFTMVGGDPYAAGTGTTTVAVPIIGLHLVFASGGATDASAIASDCGLTTSPVQATLTSPLFSSSVAGTQYVDAFQRASFGDATGASAASPDYHLLLSGSEGPELTLDVPAIDGFASPLGCGSNPGAMEGAVVQSWLQSEITAAMPSITGVSPGVFPIFLLYDTVMVESGGVSGGFHAVVPSNIQTYAVADYQEIDLGIPGASDVTGVTHEAVEWADDPFADNLAPTWGYVGQVSGCDSLLEVADPLSDLQAQAVTVGSVTYHVPDAAFVPWFFRQNPSPASGGAYSLFHTFTQTSDPSVCPAQPVSVKTSPGAGQLTVSWSEPSATSPIASFDVLLFKHQDGVDVTTVLSTSDSPLPAAASTTVPSSATSATVSGLANGTAYDVVVVALSTNHADTGLCLPLFVALAQTSTADDCSTSSFAVTATPGSGTTTTGSSGGSTQSSGANPSATQASLSSNPSSPSPATSPAGSGSQLAFTGAQDVLLLLSVGTVLIMIGAFGRRRSTARR